MCRDWSSVYNTKSGNCECNPGYFDSKDGCVKQISIYSTQFRKNLLVKFQNDILFKLEKSFKSTKWEKMTTGRKKSIEKWIEKMTSLLLKISDHKCTLLSMVANLDYRQSIFENTLIYCGSFSSYRYLNRSSRT